MGREASVGSKGLAGYGVAQTMLLLCQIANVIALRIHDDISVGLLEAHQDVHHLKLSLDDNRGVGQYACGRVIWSQDSMIVFWDMDRGEKRVGALILGGLGWQ